METNREKRERVRDRVSSKKRRERDRRTAKQTERESTERERGYMESRTKRVESVTV